MKGIVACKSPAGSGVEYLKGSSISKAVQEQFRMSLKLGSVFASFSSGAEAITTMIRMTVASLARRNLRVAPSELRAKYLASTNCNLKPCDTL